MAFLTYADLQEQVANWVDRADMAARIPDWISLAESRINADLRLTTMEHDEALTGVVGSRLIALPTGFMQPLALWWNDGTGRVDVRFVPATQIDSQANRARPMYWTVDGANIAFERPCDSAYSFTLRCSEKLDIASSVNRLLLDFPLVYLAAALVEAFAYLVDIDAASAWEGRYKAALQQAKDMANASRRLATLSVDAALIRPARFNIFRGD